MKMYPAYEKAAELARKHGQALVVTVDPDACATADHWDAVTVDDFHTPRHQRENPGETWHFFDLIEVNTPRSRTRRT